MNMQTIRILQLFIISSLALYVTLIFAGNVMDYDANYEFVKHVLAMDTTFKDPAVMWRSITNQTVVNLAYWAIIATEGIVALLGWITSAKLCRNLKRPAAQFNAAKTLGFYAFMLAIALWFIGFLTIGSEWFEMWESSTWNGKQTAMDIVQILGIFLLIYMVPVKAINRDTPEK